MELRSIVVVLALFALVNCAEPLEFADWTIPVPDGTRIIEYAAVPTEERTGLFAVERDLVVSEAFGQSFYRPSVVKVAPDGTFFVLDSGNHRVVGFDVEGTPVVSFGDEGQGPGEFQSVRQLGLAGDNVIVYDVQSARFSIFTAGGRFVSDHTLEKRIYPIDFAGSAEQLVMINPEGGFVVMPGEEDPDQYWRAGRYTLLGEELGLAIEFEIHTRGTYWQKGRRGGSVPLRAPIPLGVLGNDLIYATDASQYQVLAVAADGTHLWALRTDYTPPIVPDDVKHEIVRLRSESVEGLTYEDFTWPERYAAIENLEVDGDGNLYVFPHAARTLTTVYEADGPVPVDVYSPEGEQLYLGLVAIDGWDSALGDSLYRIETDPDSGERVVARYRIVKPFE